MQFITSKHISSHTVASCFCGYCFTTERVFLDHFIFLAASLVPVWSSCFFVGLKFPSLIQPCSTRFFIVLPTSNVFFVDELRFSFSGEMSLVRTQEGAEAAILKLRLAKVVGFDMEWYAPRVRGVSASKTAVIQICGSPDFCALFAMGYFEELPCCLKDFLCDANILKVSVF